MKINRNRIVAAALAIPLAVSSMTATSASFLTATAESGVNTVEYLNRGISAVNTGSGMMVSWRFLANDADSTVFKLYRNNELIYTSNAGEATCYLDRYGSSSSQYRVDAVVSGKVVNAEVCTAQSNYNYISIPMDQPSGGSDYSYVASDTSVGDVDGDGIYELFVKWDPTNAQDNSKTGYTGNVYIDCYTLTGQKLWRVDLGKNIRAGAHYTQHLVADFDGDGKAEMCCKTADGTVDGKGNVIGNGWVDNRDSNGLILQGNEYYTLFDGETGAALDTVNYAYPRGTATGSTAKSTWGDDYGNRCERYLGAVCYLDPDHPSAVSVRGYYTRMTAVAYDVVNKKLVKRWGFDTGFNSSAPGYGDGNHNCMPADVDGDGRQELVLGATCLDDNGQVLWCTNLGHGDAMHLGDLLPDRQGLELWVCHEAAPYGVSLLDARNGSTIFHYNREKDTGRCCADNVLASNPGAEFWGAGSTDVYNGSGQAISTTTPSQNFLAYWDGDLERELQDGIYITKMTSASSIQTIFTASGCATNNDTKSNPCLTADILGDWREELLYRTENNREIRIYCTPHETQYRITTLMHDQQYRNQVAGEQNCYNQPAHPSFYLGSDKSLPTRPNVAVNTNGNGSSAYAPVDGTLISQLNIWDMTNFRAFELVPSLKQGDLVFGDHDVVFTSLPDPLNGAEAIRTACESKYATSDIAAFTANADLTMYIALDNRVENVPSWMNGFTKTGMTAANSGDVTFDIYAKDITAGTQVSLGANGQSSYCVNYDVFFVKKAEVTTTTTTTTTTTSKALQISLAGDVDCNGKVSISDVVLLSRYCNEEPVSVSNQGFLNGDCNHDNALGTEDSTMILKAIARLISL